MYATCNGAFCNRIRIGLMSGMVGGFWLVGGWGFVWLVGFFVRSLAVLRRILTLIMSYHGG